jgi:hypothetical protein
MALHTSDVEIVPGGYQGSVLGSARQLLLAAHGGQILCSEETATLLRRDLESGTRIHDLGAYRLRDTSLPERLFQIEYAGMGDRDFPPPRAEAAHTASLPLQLTRFFGRESELDRLQELLAPGTSDSPGARLVILTGAGGCGKTRLAVEAARRLVDCFR